jgi:hypothetical protein
VRDAMNVAQEARRRVLKYAVKELRSLHFGSSLISLGGAPWHTENKI